MLTDARVISSLEEYRGFIGQELEVVVDRPLGSKHPKHDFVYPINYGYIPDTCAWDGEEVDAYILGIPMAIETYKGVCIAIIHRKDDNECKLVVVPVDTVFTSEEIAEQVRFQEQRFDSEVVM